MRLLFVTTSLVHGGAERHAITLMNRLSERGHECHAIYVKDDPGQLERIHIGGSVQTLDARHFLDLPALRRMAGHIETIAPSVILAANPYALMYAQIGRAWTRRPPPLAVSFHSTKLLGIKERLKHAIDRRLIRRADALVFVSEGQASHWRPRGLTAARVAVIPNGVDHHHFRPAPDNAAALALRARLGIAATDFVIGMVAMLRPEKNPVQLVQVVAALRQRGIPAQALLVGDGPLRSAVEAAAGRLGVAGQVHVTGIQEDVRPWLAASNVIVLCSLTEALSLAALEAMAMHRPVVHPAVGGGADMILPGFNGDLYPVGDTAALTASLAGIARPGQSARLGRNAARVVEEKFSEAMMVTRYESLLDDLARTGSAPRAA